MNPHKWNWEFSMLNPGATLLAESYCKVFDGTYTSEQSRDIVRAYLNNEFPNKFPYGHGGTVLAKVIWEVLSSIHGLYVWSRYVVCGTVVEELGHQHMLMSEHINRGAMTTSEIICKGMRTRCHILLCFACGGQMQDSVDFVKVPKLISIFIDAQQRINIDKNAKLMNKTSRNTILNLWGLIYYADFHFVLWVIDVQGRLWYSDGWTMGCISTINGTLWATSNDDILSRGNKMLVAAIYAQTWITTQ